MPISNMIFVAESGQNIDLYHPDYMEIMMYQPPRTRFPGGCVRLASGTFLIFASGKVVINGVKNFPDVTEFENLTKIKLSEPKLSHVSGYMKVQPMSLPNIIANVRGAVYEPEIHPGLFFKINNISIIVYHTGSIIYCGCRTLEESLLIEESIKNILGNVYDN